MSQFKLGDFENGIRNSQISDTLVKIKADEIVTNLLKIPEFNQLMKEDVNTVCKYNTNGVNTMFPDVCINDKVVFSKPNRNIENLKRHVIQRIDEKLEIMGQVANFNRNKLFNYYTNQYDYYFKKDLDIVCADIYKDMTIDYFDDKYFKFNKIASNPWNREHTKTKRQEFKISQNDTDKLTFSQTFNHIDDCFI